jgi:hypothetical protein
VSILPPSGVKALASVKRRGGEIERSLAFWSISRIPHTKKGLRVRKNLPLPGDSGIPEETFFLPPQILFLTGFTGTHTHTQTHSALCTHAAFKTDLALWMQQSVLTE